LIFGADDHFIRIAINRDEALGLLNLLDQIIDGHGFKSPAAGTDRSQACLGRKLNAFI
jgi:hypothetical protein